MRSIAVGVCIIQYFSVTSITRVSKEIILRLGLRRSLDSCAATTYGVWIFHSNSVL